MTLGAIYRSAEAWGRLTTLKLPPLIGYRLLKYVKQVKAEYDLIKEQESRLIRDFAGVGPQDAARLDPDSLAFHGYAGAFSTILEAPSDVAPCDLTLEAMVEALGQQTLSVQDLGALEPFFSPEANKEDGR